jgi:hypothetical protein
MIRTFAQIGVSLAFLIVNMIALLIVLELNRQTGRASRQPPAPAPPPAEPRVLQSSGILDMEFEYARVTASESMEQRHTLVNFYLVVAGVLSSGVVAVLDVNTRLPESTGTVLLWLLCGIGWLYFLSIIRLRQAWHDSAQAMNQIKDFYIEHAQDVAPDVLCTAFRWRSKTLPPPGKPWTVFFYSAMLIALLDSVAYTAGGVLLNLEAAQALPWLVLGPLGLFGLAFVAFHVWLYFAFFR